MEGAPETGVTVMYMAEELDAGDIILQERQPIGFTDTAGELGERLAQAGARLLRRAVDEIAAGTARRIPQDHSRASYAPPLRTAEERLEWTDDALSLHNRIRALNPRPGAYTTYRGRRLKIWRALPADAAGGLLPEQVEPGQIASVEGGRLIVAAGGGSYLELLELQPEGKRRLGAAEFCRGYRPAAGERLGD